MRHIRNYADFGWAFSDKQMAAEAIQAITSTATNDPNGCLNYSGHRCAKGYGRVQFAGKQWIAHRLLWMLVNGDIGKLVIDHKCRNPSCVNLAHLEPVPNRVNVMRGASAYGNNVCAKGHTIVRTGGRNRGCPTCKKQRDWERAKQRLAADPEYLARKRRIGLEGFHRRKKAKATA